MKIVAPREAQAMEGDVIAVVLDGRSDGPVGCRLVAPDVWQDFVLHGVGLETTRFVTAEAVGEEVRVCSLPAPADLFGRAIIVVCDEQNAIHDAICIVLGRSTNAPIRRPSPTAQAVRWPISLAISTLTTFDVLVGQKEHIDSSEVERARFLDPMPDLSSQSCVLESSEPLSVGSSLRRSLCTGSDLEGFTRLDARMTWTPPTLYCIRFNEALVDLSNGVVMDGEGRVWADSAVATLANPTSVLRTTGWFHAASTLGLALDVEPVTISTARPVMVFCHWASLVNHAHWVMNSLASVFAMLPELQDRRLDLLAPILTFEQRSQLVWMGVPREAIIEADDRFVSARDVVFPSPLSTAANLNPPPSSVTFFQYLRQVRPRRLVDTPKRIFFTRRGFASGRRISNEAEVEDLLSELGFVAVAPHELSLAEEIDLMVDAEVVVAQLGAALTNIAFCKSGTRIIELTSSNYTSNEYCLTSSLCGQEYVRLMTKPVEDTLVNDGNFEFPVDLGALRRAILTL